MSLQAVLDDLLAALGASRCTIRREVEGDFFPVTHEALAPGAPSIRDERTVDLRTAPVVRQLVETRRQVVQDDCARAFDDPDFQRMLAAYGGLAAQVVTPVFAGDRLAAILSVHQLGAPRHWSAEELDLAAGAANKIRTLIGA